MPSLKSLFVMLSFASVILAAPKTPVAEYFTNTG